MIQLPPVSNLSASISVAKTRSDVKVQTTSFNYSLEALRGFAALVVVLCHSLYPSADPTYQLHGIWQYPMPGHLSVLIFFILSGYVIGITNKKPIITFNERKEYLRKRIVRIYPLYFISIIITVAVAASIGIHYKTSVVIGYLLFLQSLAVEVPTVNSPVWSLSYEIVYYLLFLVVSARQWPAKWVIVSCLMLGLVFTKLQLQPIVLASYFYGAVFWFIGIWISQAPKSDEEPDYGRMLALICLVLSYSRLDIGYSILSNLGLDVTEAMYPNLADRFITFSDLSRLIFCIPLIMCFANRKIVGLKVLERIAFILPAFYIIIYIVSGKAKVPALFNSFFLPTIVYGCAFTLYIAKKYTLGFGKLILQKMVFLGSISYGIYIIHYPLYFIFKQIPFFGGTATSFTVRLLLHLVVVCCLAWLLEIKVQPWFKAKFTPKVL